MDIICDIDRVIKATLFFNYDIGVMVLIFVQFIFTNKTKSI